MKKHISIVYLLWLSLATTAYASLEEQEVTQKLNSMSETERKVHSLSLLLSNFVHHEHLSQLVDFNAEAAELKTDEVSKINSTLLTEVQEILEDKLPMEISAFEMGQFPLYEAWYKNIILYCAINKNQLTNSRDFKDRLLAVCSLYRSWYNDENNQVTQAIGSIYEHYQVTDEATPMFKVINDFDFTDQTIFSMAYGFSYITSKPHRTYATLAVVAGIAVWGLL